MSDSLKHGFKLPPEQQAIRDKCFHPSGTFVEFPIEDVETSIPARFDKMVQQYRDRIAVRTETQVVTYGELNAMAHRFARALLRRQGPTAQLVALLLEKDVAQIAAMLGVMRAGKFFLILDPSFPKARLTAMLQDSRAKLIVTSRQNALLANEIVTGDRQVMRWETIDDAIADDHLRLSILPKALAFINYTSGSTGEPKGLLRTHRMILHNIMSRTNLIHVCEHDRISLLSSGTSNAITNSLLALLNGAGLYSLEVKKKGVARLARWLVEEKITIAPMSSPLFRSLCETLRGNNNFRDLRVIRLRSEAVYKSDADLYKQFFSPNCIFVTGLSSNETGPLADYLIDHDTIVIESAVPVGYPVPGKEVVLLNQDGEKIGFDEVGEIVVRSRYLSPGYLRNPRLAKAKFKRDPTENGNRTYLTRDMGLMLSDGCLIHKGRKDFRVKIRGYPVDLKEVEIALRAHPSIHDSVITARTNQLGETVLVAYFVIASQRAPTVSDLVRFLAQTLADYMIPAAFVRLERMPLGPHNKVDRTALPPPAETRPNLDGPFMAPRSETERQLAEIWAEVLGIDKVGIQDNFFDLGGHSLAATRIVTRVIGKFHLELPLQVLFDSPTVRKMAVVITEHQNVDHERGELRSQPSRDAVQARPAGPTIDFTRFPKEEVERSIPERFEKMVAMYPDRLAVKMGVRSLTYDQLNQGANRIARAILEMRGPGSEPIALLFEHGTEVIAPILGVLKAGKFFVSLDPTFPMEWNRYLCDDSGSRVIIANRQNAVMAKPLAKELDRLITVDDLDLASSVANLGSAITPSTLACLIYTSGSTGTPKAVIQNHRNFLHATMRRINSFHISIADRLTLLSSGFNQALMNIFSALLGGACVCPFNAKQAGATELVRWLEDEEITIYHSSASLFRQVIGTLTGNEDLSRIRLIRSASEAVTKGDVELYRKHFSSKCIYINGLSTTETGTATLSVIDKNTPITTDTVPIGYPLQDIEVLLLDDGGQPVPTGHAGEIAIRSSYLSPGYWRRSDLTSAKFLADPQGGDKRTFLTGDLGRKLNDSCLEHLGRKDFQLKIRGYRVETGEVELKILDHPGVKEVAVIGRKAQTGENRLIAYFVPTKRPEPRVGEFRSFLSKTVPDFMIPSAFVALDNLPRTLNGKVDRHALPDLAHSRPDLDCFFVPPRHAIENDLAKIWEEVLGLDRVGILDNFFDLGGHSLTATRIVSRVIDMFRLELPLQVFFDSPTVEKMAAVISQHQVVDHKPRGPRSQRSGNTVQARPVEPNIDFTPFPKEDVELSIPERFEKIVGMYPDRIAVKTGNEVVTYSQLNAMANRMAHAIVARRGIEAEAVAILLDKGARLMAAMLGVLKAGKFIVLLERSSPKARLATVLEDSHAGLIISERQYSEVTRHFSSADSNLLEFDSTASHAAEENLSWNISPNLLATVNYTSGSTGEPKGVIWAHRNLLHQVMLFTNAYKLSECDRLLLTTSGTANAMTIGFAALLNGAALLPFDVQIHGVNRLVHWLLDEKISICWIGSPLFRNICQALTGGEKFPDVRILRLASEASYKSDIELYKQHFVPECLLINGLANTESGLISLYPVDSKTEISGQEVPVGYPVEDKEVLLLDDSGKEVGPNEVGEIAVRSRYLSPGYWHRPELTADKFKPDPNGGDQCIYLSGDLGLMLPDGCLIHKGRKDFRVKIRGYGVEIAEVEKVLNTYAAVGQAVVVAREKESDEARLVAYYTCTGLPTPTVTELRGFLRKQLPDFMIPSTFVMLDTIPLTHSGKVDRRAFPDPDNVRPTLAAQYLSSRNEIEQKLVAIWEEVLDVCPVGVNDGFFDLGGDSLSATRVISQVIKHFQLEIPLQSLFQSPTIADMASVVTQRQGKLSGNDRQDHLAAFSLVSVSQEGLLPLSYSQQRLWFLDQLEPGGFTYNLFSAYRLKGELNVVALEQSFNEIIRRHEILRTVFKSEGGSPTQVILPISAIKIPIFDLRGTVSEEDRWIEVRRMSKEEAQRPFDLATGPLLRITLLQLADDEYVLLRAMHHIVSDGWSEGVLFHELSEIYAALLTGKPSPLADLPAQYPDYAKWQKQWFQGERLDSQLSYWKKQLKYIPTLRLPTDRPREAIQTSRGARHYFALSHALSAELKKLSHKHGATLFMTLLAAFQTLLHRYSGQTDIVIGSPVAGRSRREFEELIGFFLNTLVLRLDLSGNPTFGEALSRVREVCLGALSHQELPFEKLVEELHPDRNLGQNPLFQVTFAFQNTPRFSPQLSGISVNELEMETGVARFDLHLFMEEKNGGLQGYFDYNTDLFNADTIERLLGHFQNLLAGIVTDPDCRISDLPLLTQAEKHQLLVEWNDTKADYPKNKCIQELFEAQVERAPEAVAVVFEDKALTYRDLNQRANQLAHHLQKLGVGPEILVGICMERSLEMVVGILGILKAGGAYVPLDPQCPKERLALMLEDTRAQVLITQDQLIEKLPTHNAAVICLDRDWGEISGESHDNPLPVTTSDNLAYVIYTSGSTGIPKGVLITHHNVVRLFRATDFWFHFSPDDVWTLFHSYAFDFSVWELWGALLHGGRLVVVPFEVSRSPQEFYDLLCREQVTVLNQTPSAFRQLMEAEDSVIEHNRLGLRLVIFGGESLDFHSLKPWFEHHGDQKPQLINMYGITETTVHVTYRAIKESDIQSSVSSLIGVPLPDLELYVLDQYRNLVPVGVPGELYVGGVGLARGYLNRADLTAERFILSPFRPGERLYRSGDLARYLPSRDIEYLGRIDDQVKIRGYRIELGEIEAVLGQHPTLREAVVLAREDSRGDRRLVAYVFPRQKPSPAINELRSFLGQKLPDYMVPSAFVFLDTIPLTPNGKTDRKALPAPSDTRPALEEEYVVPRTPTEQSLADIWAELLRVDRVGVHGNFFDLGGHSLLATQVIVRIRNVFRINMPLRALFETPTVAGIAEHLESIREAQAVSRALPVALEAIDEKCPLSFSQERFWFLDQLQPNNLAYSVAYGFRLDGPLNIKALEQAISEIVTRHETLRTTFQQRNGRLVQVISEQWSFRLSIVDLSKQSVTDMDAGVQRILESDRRRRFDLSADLLLRATLLRLEKSEHFLLLTSHHIAWDHWCIEVFFRELSILYHAFANGEISPLSALPIQYKHYALRQRNELRDTELGQHLAYWKQQLADAPLYLNLPTDYPRKPLQNRRGDRQTLVLPEELNDALRSLSKEARVTLFMTLLAAFQTLLCRMTGQDDIVVGTPIAGRNLFETEKLIGLFLNTLALRTKLSDDPSFLKLLTRVRDIAIGAYEHQDLPFEKLVEELQPDRDLSTTPIFQVFINMYNFKESTLELDRLSVTRLPPGESGEQFDITLSIREHADGLHLTFGYDADLFEAATIRRMLRHFEALLRGIVDNPDQRISDLPMLTDVEKHKLLVEWNDTKRDYPKNKCIHELIETQVERAPESVAVVFEDQQLTYRKLNARANQLANHLRKLGVGPEVLVAICVERSVEMIIAVLSVLKAGGGYVPLDPAYPKERLAFILEETQAPVLLTQRRLIENVSDSGAHVICLDGAREFIALESEENPESGATSDNLAYVIYTSGSTGKPKGVMIQHRALSNHMLWMQERFPLDAADCVLQKTPFCFDASVWEFFAPMMAGARLSLARPGGHQDGAYLINTIVNQRVTTLQLVPSMLRMLLAEDGLERCQSLKRVFCGGEALPVELREQFHGRLGGELYNLYGPTEATIDATCARCDRASPPHTVTIGRPIANTQVYVLDPALRPVPIGFPGQLYIGGECLARGYLNRPELTAEKFITHSFDGEPARRLYRTGDLARYLSDGNIEFLGRIDDQVKIRGYRIELGEIESVLSQHPGVRESVVVAREDAPGDKRLVAYVVGQRGSQADAHELRTFLRHKLPEYMVPSVFVFLESLPLTSNGKIDQKSLPAPDLNREELEQAYVAPRSPTEEILAGIWAEVLKLDRVGIHDNFFDLGGHSLLATQVVSRMRKVFQKELPLRHLFEFPTIAELAAVISASAEQQIANSKNIDLLLTEIEAMSEREAQKQFAEKSAPSRSGYKHE